MITNIIVTILVLFILIALITALVGGSASLWKNRKKTESVAFAIIAIALLAIFADIIFKGGIYL